jgi:UDP-N-acetylglucosamine/UDP-N-acetylgalactosamine diphosphorylase
MVQFSGFETIIKTVYDFGQEGVFRYWDDLSEHDKRVLLTELSSVDFASLDGLFKETKSDVKLDTSFGPAPFIPRPRNVSDAAWQKAKAIGEDQLKAGRVAAFVVAGGQGSRLGFDGPKGAYRMSPVKNKSLFQIHAEKVKKYSMKYGVPVPFFIMTSDINHAATVDHFEENDYFGLHKKDVFLFPQNMIPSLDTEGKLILSAKGSIFKNPDGHGGSLTALRTSGALDEMKKRGIEVISYFQVDNPTVNIVDPVFVGYHHTEKAEVSSKALLKAYPDEKVGSFVRWKDGSEGVVEYSDLPKDKMFEKNADGSLTYAAGSIAIHLFSREYIERVTSGGSLSLPFHVARKKIKKFTREGESEIDGFKFEKFVFDALPLAKKSIIIECLREEEFAPVKNASGVDSVETSRALMSDLFKSWAAARGISVPSAVKVLEISPIVAVAPEDLPAGMKIPAEENVYIG